ncbi:MAG: hypothetical protein ABUJ92_13140 [Desulfobacterales bacterium]
MRLAYSGMSLGYGFIDGFQGMGQSTYENAIRGKINRPEFDMGFSERTFLILGHFIKLR